MKTVTVRDLRNNFAKVEAWLAEGEPIRVEKRGKPVAYLSTEAPESGGEAGKRVLPDFEARLQRLWGNRVFTEEEVEAMREAEEKNPFEVF
ncbi:type II toxin-antitoxin system Phd/YefM family antitoxin [Roseibacillus ishigakijimensis]|uniref:Type II toxin-antitoxin system Phd/YefM family antitoxin n=1 Tax=Roseibacillus ishigakijimensis TaxID=454146 RepID=A0A934RNV0_9BACT|nr:type II toxin-antitoxin system Phd/YefM family antitoxin [Roseibacillus ishigakijimensis]MBK1835222.1 type II toxin-antitoxin system Phd/YefM family antitoxin [Roseibacillus ishigakijimensis]